MPDQAARTVTASQQSVLVPSPIRFFGPNPRRRELRLRSRKRIPGRLARHLFQIGERRVDRAGAGLAGVFDDTVEPAVAKENGALARLTIVAFGVARGEAQATDIAQPPADCALHRLGHGGVTHA